MTQVKLTKNELRLQQYKLVQLEKYLPTLKLKKAMLQIEVSEARIQVQRVEHELELAKPDVERGAKLLSMAPEVNIEQFIHITSLKCESENIAGVEVPVFRSIEFSKAPFLFSQTPVWFDRLVDLVRQLKTLTASCQVFQWRVQALEKELREVSIRVNLFEKILIPRAVEQIKRIRIFLQDQELASVGRAKVAKSKHRPETVQELEVL